MSPLSRPLHKKQKRAAAALGQAVLTQAWRAAAEPYDMLVAQLLLTLNDTENRQQYLNARETVHGLLDVGALPVINENDAVADAAFKYGDNDRLAARVAEMIGADRLILLSDIDGLYTADPSKHPEAAHLPLIDEITPQIEAMAGGSISEFGTGGMATKLAAAKIAVRAGCDMLIANGQGLHPLRSIEDGTGRHTLFKRSLSPQAARKRWIFGTLAPAGSVHVDAGAATALASGKGLLAVGVNALEGDFRRGDCVRVLAPNGNEVARGLIGYDAEDLRKICGLRSAHIADALRVESRREPVIHRDDLVLTD